MTQDQMAARLVLGREKLVWVRRDSGWKRAPVDIAITELVHELNRIPGVYTLFSCQGGDRLSKRPPQGPKRLIHRHSSDAYVLLMGPHEVARHLVLPWTTVEWRRDSFERPDTDGEGEIVVRFPPAVRRNMLDHVRAFPGPRDEAPTSCLHCGGSQLISGGELIHPDVSGLRPCPECVPLV